MKLIPLATILLSSAVLAQTQPASSNWDLKADLETIDKCAQATRLVIKAAELYPTDKKTRDRFIETVLQDIQKTNQLGSQTPSDVNVLFAKVDDLLEKANMSNPQERDILVARSAGMCTLHSSRILKNKGS